MNFEIILVPDWVHKLLASLGKDLSILTNREVLDDTLSLRDRFFLSVAQQCFYNVFKDIVDPYNLVHSENESYISEHSHLTARISCIYEWGDKYPIELDHLMELKQIGAVVDDGRIVNTAEMLGTLAGSGLTVKLSDYYGFDVIQKANNKIFVRVYTTNDKEKVIASYEQILAIASDYSGQFSNMATMQLFASYLKHLAAK